MNSGTYRKKPKQKISTNLNWVTKGLAQTLALHAALFPGAANTSHWDLSSQHRAGCSVKTPNSWLSVTGTPVFTGGDLQIQLLTERKQLHLYCG